MKPADGTLAWLLVIGLGVPLVMLWLVAYVDVARRKDLRVGRKVLWAGAIFFGAYVGIAAYFVMRPLPTIVTACRRPRIPQTESRRGRGHSRRLSGKKTRSPRSHLKPIWCPG